MSQPVVIQDSIAIGAGVSVENVIVVNNSLRALQRLPFRSRLLLAATASANGLFLDLNLGADNVVASSNPRTSASTPEIPFDVINDQAYGEEGQMLALRAVNPTGASITLRYIIIAEEWADELPPQRRVMQQGPIVVANGIVDLQLMDGLRYERAPLPSILTVWMTQSAGGLLRQVFVDMDRVAPASAISLANRVPQDPQDLTVAGIQVLEDKPIQLMVSNQSGGALNIFWKIALDELVRR